MQDPWKTDRWFVSPWNFAPEVVSQLEFPQQIRVHDITLRDGEQQTGVEFTRDDKIRIAEKLAEVGVHRIEAGMPVVSKSDEQAIKEIVKRNLGPEIFAFSRCMVDDVKRAADCGVKGIVMEIPSSTHIIQHAYRWPLEKAIELSIESTRYAHEQGLYVVFFPIDSTRAELDWFLNLITKVATDGHMDALAVVDTFGVLSVHAMRYLVRQLKRRIQKPLETHFHMDFGLGVANTLLALAAGCEVMHTTVLGIGERAGNTPMEETALALLTMYGVDLGLKWESLTELAQLVRELSGQAVASNHPVYGDLLFAVESGIIASWYKNCGVENATELFPYRWELVGQQPAEVVLGKGSGIDSVKMWLDRTGFQASDEEALELLQLVKSHSLEKKGLLSEDEFRRLAESVVTTPVVA
ncbi:MAG: hypothetical protein M5U01_32345 [Ardenticatenaceae bacterium]|nr:hypothetical protein [Ardenticatenaceae bacterium]HBY95925.1 pyruvate carboxyltransferase [Chloroflexota bacterium]